MLTLLTRKNRTYTVAYFDCFREQTSSKLENQRSDPVDDLSRGQYKFIFGYGTGGLKASIMPLCFKEDIQKQLKEFGIVKNFDHREIKAKLPNMWTADNLEMDLYLEVEGYEKKYN